MRFLHEVNFISAEVTCTLCIQNGKWKQQLSEENNCEICGFERSFTWSKRDFQTTKVDKKYITRNPLRQFTKWLLYYFNKREKPQHKYHTLALAHNGVFFKSFKNSAKP